MQLRVAFAILSLGFGLAACEVSTGGPEGERHFLNDGTPFYLEYTGVWMPASGGEPSMDFRLAAGEPGENLFSLGELADRSFAELIGPTAAKYGWDQVRVQMRTHRRAGLNGPVQTHMQFYEMDENGVWARRGVESSGAPFDVMETRNITIGETEHTIRLLAEYRGYVVSQGRLGQVLEYDCPTCEGDMDAVGRLTYRLVAEEREAGRWTADETVFELRVYSGERLSNWHFPMPTLIHYHRLTTREDWAPMHVTEDDYTDYVLAQNERYRVEGRLMRSRAQGLLSPASSESDE